MGIETLNFDAYFSVNNPPMPMREMSASLIYPASYYAATINRNQFFPSITHAEKIDVAVIGAGFTGLSAALELARRGYNVRLIEKSLIGFGASGRNGGQVTPGYSVALSKLAKLLKTDDLKPIWQYSVDAVNLVKSRINEYKIECDMRPGVIATAISEGHMADLRADQEILRRECQDDHMEIWDQQRLFQSMKTARYIGGGLDKRSFSINPLKYCLGLAVAAHNLGVKIAEQTEITKIDGDGRGNSVYRLSTRSLDKSSFGVESTIMAQYVVLATDSYGIGLVPQLNGTILSVPSLIIATKPIPDLLQQYYPGGEAVADCNTILDYFRPTYDGRLLFGGRAYYSGRQPKNIAAALLPRLVRVFPELRDVGVDYSWGGLIGLSLRRMPQFGMVSPNFYYAQGYSGQGIALGNHAGLVLAEAIDNNRQMFDVMKNWPKPKFPGWGPLQSVLLSLGMLWYAMKDAKS